MPPSEEWPSYSDENMKKGYGRRVHFPIFQDSHFSETSPDANLPEVDITYRHNVNGKSKNQNSATRRRQCTRNSKTLTENDDRKRRRVDRRTNPESNITTFHSESVGDNSREYNMNEDFRPTSNKTTLKHRPRIENYESSDLDRTIDTKQDKETDETMEAIRQYIKDFDEEKKMGKHNGSSVKKKGLNMSKSDEKVMLEIFKKCKKTERKKLKNKNNNANCMMQNQGCHQMPSNNCCQQNMYNNSGGLPPVNIPKNSLPLSVFSAYSKIKPRIIERKPQLRDRLTDMKDEISYANPCRAELRRQCQCIIEQKRYVLMKNSDSDTVDSDMEGITRCQLETATSDMRIGFLFRFGCKRVKKTPDDLRKDYEAMQEMQEQYDEEQRIIELKNQPMFGGMDPKNFVALKLDDNKSSKNCLDSATESKSEISSCDECDAIMKGNFMNSSKNNSSGIQQMLLGYVGNQDRNANKVSNGMKFNNASLNNGNCTGNVGALNSMMFPKTNKKKTNRKNYKCKLTTPKCDSSDDDCLLNDDEIIHKYGANRKCMDPRYKIVKKNPPRCKFNNCCEFSYFARCDDMASFRQDGPGTKKAVPKKGCPNMNNNKTGSHGKCKKSSPTMNTLSTSRKSYSLGPRAKKDSDPCSMEKKKIEKKRNCIIM